jgi:lysophospholipase L1-like esterase
VPVLTSPSEPNWRLRGALLLVFVVLVFISLIATAAQPRATQIAITSATSRPPSPSHISPTPAAPTTTTVPGAVTGGVTRAVAGDGCGLSLVGGPDTAAVGHCTVLEIGDSLGNDLGWGLARSISPASGINLVQMDKSSTGLANTSFYNWPAQLASDLATYHPQLVLVCLGGNDEQGMEINGSAVQFPSQAWQAAYLSRVRDLIDQATAAGAYVMWIGMPVMQQPQYSEGMQVLNAIYRQAAAASDDATFVSTWSLFAGPGGGFESSGTVNGTPASLRQGDGIHFSFTGENVIATYVIHEMALVYHVPIRPLSPAL